MKRAFTLLLDEDSSHVEYWLYRSTELNNGNGGPVVDGVYIWRPELGTEPPEVINISIEWGQNTELEQSMT
jgi:hypothetical protein